MAVSAFARGRQQTSRLNDCVVLIDDSPSILETLAYPLRETGYAVYTAENGRAGLIEIARRHPKVVVVDLLMPHMSGYELLDGIRKDAVLRDISAIVITGITNDPRDLAKIAPQADVCLGKPVDIDELLGRVEEAFANYNASSHLGGRLQR